MRVFILCTGRSGSSAIIQACRHITNFTVGHETQTQFFGDQRFDFADQHIEADNRLSWHLGQLNEKYGDEPFYIHLKRNREAVAKSFKRRYFLPGSMIDAYTEGIHKMPPEKLTQEERNQACFDYVDTVNSNIDLFLKDKSKKLEINLESIKKDFEAFWSFIGAEGDLNAALAEFDKKHNSSSKRTLNLPYRLKLLFKREVKHWKMALKN